MRTLFACLLGLIAGYVLGALIGYATTIHLSPNLHDKDLEAAMTAAFVTGPVGALLGAIAGYISTRKRR